MSEVKLQRLEIETRFGHAGAVMVNDDSGDYYRADDVDEAITTLQRERDELKKQRDELQAIVDKLPRTADGKPIASGMTLYRETRRTGTVEPHIVSDDVRAINEDLFINWPVSECYSTREAAEAAKGGEG